MVLRMIEYILMIQFDENKIVEEILILINGLSGLLIMWYIEIVIYFSVSLGLYNVIIGQ